MYFRVYLGLRAFSPLTLGFYIPGRWPDEKCIHKANTNRNIKICFDFLCPGFRLTLGMYSDKAIRAYEKAGFAKIIDSPDQKEIIMIATQNVPMPTGPYQVGTTKYDLTDVYRKELEHPNGRLIPIQIYFPMHRGEHTLLAKIIEPRVPGPWEPLKAMGYSQKADISLLADGRHPLALVNHAKAVSLADYAFLAEDLASHGYIVVSIQHQLNTDQEEPHFWLDRSLSRNAKIIDNLLYVFEWLKENHESLFANKIDLKRTGLIGHSMGGNSLLLLANRRLSSFQKNNLSTLLPRYDNEGVRECVIALEPTGFPYPLHHRFPLFFLLAEEREAYQKQSGCYDEMRRAGHQVHYYKGAKHTSFMDHGYINPPNPFDPGEHYFNGTVEERKTFFDAVRKDIRDFLSEHIGSTNERHSENLKLHD